MNRAGIILALLVASFVCLLFVPLFFQVPHQFERHVEARADDFELSHSSSVASKGQRNHA